MQKFKILRPYAVLATVVSGSGRKIKVEKFTKNSGLRHAVRHRLNSLAQTKIVAYGMLSDTICTAPLVP